MIKVSFNGLIRSNHQLKSFETTAETLGELIEKILETYPKIKSLEIDQAVIFVNRKHIRGLYREKYQLTPGDEVIFTNYVGGG